MLLPLRYSPPGNVTPKQSPTQTTIAAAAPPFVVQTQKRKPPFVVDSFGRRYVACCK